MKTNPVLEPRLRGQIDDQGQRVTSPLRRWGKPLFVVGCVAVGVSVTLCYHYFYKASETPPPPTEFTAANDHALPVMRGVSVASLPVFTPAATTSARGQNEFGSLQVLNLNWVTITVTAGDLAESQRLGEWISLAHKNNVKVCIVAPELAVDSARKSVRVNPVITQGYANVLKQSAQLAAEVKADMLAVGGDEMALDLGANFWTLALGSVKQIYKQPIVYTVPLEHYGRVDWGSGFDYLGIMGPFPLSAQPKPTPYQLELGWRTHLMGLESFSAQHKKPVILMNVAVPGEHPAWPMAHSALAAGSAKGPYIQKLCYEGALIATKGQPWLVGVFWSGKLKYEGAVLEEPLGDLLRQHWRGEKGQK